MLQKPQQIVEQRRALKAAFGPSSRDVCYADDGCADVADLMAEDVEETIMSALHERRRRRRRREGLMLREAALKRLERPTGSPPVPLQRLGQIEEGTI